jgi:hypothetical protein
MLILNKYDFAEVCSLEPIKGVDGKTMEFMPQERYANSNGLSLNRYGDGPFCQFGIPSSWTGKAGVYMLLVDGNPRYIGECQDLFARFNLGYGIISPRKCYKGGQETNCRINSLILKATNNGCSIDLVFHETNNRIEIEQELISHLNPPWNRSAGRMPGDRDIERSLNPENQNRRLFPVVVVNPGAQFEPRISSEEIKPPGELPDFSEIWARIGDHAGEEFTQIRGQKFKYTFHYSHINPSTTNQNIPRVHFEQAYEQVPLKSTSQINHLRGPSYIFAILMDRRITRNDY